MPIPTHRSRSLALASKNRLPFAYSATNKHSPRTNWTPSSALAKALLEDEISIAKGTVAVAVPSERAGSDSEGSGSEAEGAGGADARAPTLKGGAVEVNLAELAKAKRSFSRSASSDFEVIPRHKPVLALPDDAFAPSLRGPTPVDFAADEAAGAGEPAATPGEEWEVLDFDAEADSLVEAVPAKSKAASKRSWARIVG